MARLILLNKPFQMLSQFTDARGRPTLADVVTERDVYPAGRLDYDSEGLLLLTDDGALQHRIASPSAKLPKTYWVQVDGVITEAALVMLGKGIVLSDGMTRPAQAAAMTAPEIWPRNPPIRERQNQPTSWLSLTITEGRNRQVRRMTSAVGFPTLRLIRARIGDWTLDNLQPGQWREITVHLPRARSGTGPAGSARRRGRPVRNPKGDHR